MSNSVTPSQKDLKLNVINEDNDDDEQDSLLPKGNIKPNKENGKDKEIQDHDVKEANPGFFQAFNSIVVNSLVVSSVYFINTITRNVCYYFIKDYGTVHTSAFGVGNTFLTIFCIAIIVSLNVGMLINSSKSFGLKDYKSIGANLHRCIIINICMLIPITILIIFSKDFLEFLNYGTELAYLVHQFLFKCIPGMWMYVAFNTLNFYLNSMKIFKPQGVIQVISSLVFIGFSTLFIQKYHLGLVGAALAYNIMNLVSIILMILYLIFFNPAPESMYWFTSESLKGIWNQFKEEISIGITLLAAWVGNEIYSFVSGSLGDKESAAFLCVMATTLIFQTFRIGSNDTSSSYISYCVGVKSVKGVHTYVRANLIYVLTYSLTGFLILMVFPRAVSYLYIQDEAVVERAIHLSRIMAPTILSDGLGNMTAVIFRAIGCAGPLVRISLISAFLLGTPTGLILALKCGLGATGLALGYLITSTSNLTGQIIYMKFFMNLDQRIAEGVAQKKEENVEKEEKEADIEAAKK